MELNFKEKQKIISFFGNNDKNSGNTESQIAILTSKINYLQKHFLKNRKDYHSKQGLLKSVSKRRKLINYLKNKNIKSYNNIIKTLSIRH